jgi:hypothetical protein
MFLPGITFSVSRPVDSGLSSRADVAMFVGCVARRPGPVPDALKAALDAAGWSAAGLFRVKPERLEALLDIPVPVESWSEFDALYAWERRPSVPKSGDMLPTSLGLAVRSFFDEGGAKAYIVRTGDPPPLADPEMKPPLFAVSKMRLLSWDEDHAPADAAVRAPILPGFRSLGRSADPADPKTWSGAAAIFAVDDAAMLVLPDLIDICAGSPIPVPPVPEPPGPPEQFRPCAPPAPELAPIARVARPEYRAPRMNRAGYALWAGALRYALDLLGTPKGPAHRRDAMLLSAFPLPLVEAGFDGGEEVWPLAILDLPDLPASKLSLLDAGSIGSARLQLAYPWVETAASLDLPEGVQSPEGILAGMIARTSLADGAFRSAAGRPCLTPRRLQPELVESDIRRGLPGAKADWLGERLCLIGRKRGRIELLSDATMAMDSKWRAGGVSRLMGIILRAARSFGDALMFEPSGPRLWARIRSTVQSFLEGLWRRGALDGRTRDLAFEVVCDETSMTQADMDAGRVICRVGFTAAYPIQHISVSLLLLQAASGQAKAAA